MNKLLLTFLIFTASLAPHVSANDGDTDDTDIIYYQCYLNPVSCF
ncbi:hypothetical protein GCM10007987_00550 [Aliivibrio fischeri]|nr:hypothetical protein GCM10007987_00550 [Aliivibrio fischeri]